MKVLCSINDIDDESSKEFELDEQSIFAIKKDGQIYIYANKCPHLGVELNWQENQFLDMDGSLIQCATHGALFIIESGECVSGPCLGKTLQPIDFEIKNEQITLLDYNTDKIQ